MGRGRRGKQSVNVKRDVEENKSDDNESQKVASSRGRGRGSRGRGRPSKASMMSASLNQDNNSE